jgi:hypothetical protein
LTTTVFGSDVTNDFGTITTLVCSGTVIITLDGTAVEIQITGTYTGDLIGVVIMTTGKVEIVGRTGTVKTKVEGIEVGTS